MRRCTTPTVTLETNIDLTEYDKIIVTFKQGDIIVNKTDSDLSIDGTIIKVELTQEDTKGFVDGHLEVQFKGIKKGVVVVSDIAITHIYNTLNDEVMA